MDDVKEHQYDKPYIPSDKELTAIKETLEAYTKGKSILDKSYSYLGGRSLLEAIDDWTKRWNGYIPPQNPLLDSTQSQIFINFTRNAIIGYLSKVALAPTKAHIIPVNKKSGLIDQKFSEVLEDLNTYSLNAENGEAKFLQAALECVVKGTVVVYEGYMKNVQESEVPDKYDAQTGEMKTKKVERILYDDCYQEVVPLEDFLISNPFQPDVQKQPEVIWRRITSKSEADLEFGHYKNWEFVQGGKYAVTNDTTTFYRNALLTELQKDQVEIIRRYNKSKNKLIVMVNGVILYNGILPFKDGRYPFAKTVNEPFGNDFFWGNGHPNKYMGEQDLINTFINVMADKTMNSLQPTGLSSDLDDLIEDDRLEIGKFRQVSDINNWKWFESPPVNSGEMGMFTQLLTLAREAANTDAGGQFSPKGGKLTQQQILMKQQEVQQRLSFNMNFLEDLERDRTDLRVHHILQFYSIPKMEAITGKGGKEIKKLAYRDVQLHGQKLSSGEKGTKVIKLINGDDIKTDDGRKKVADDLSVVESMGELSGTPTEALAVSVDIFYDYNLAVQVVKNSSYQKNQALDQATRMEFANWRLGLAQVAPLNTMGLIKWVEESFDIDTEQFENEEKQQPAQGEQGPGQLPKTNPGQSVLSQTGPTATKQAASM